MSAALEHLPQPHLGRREPCFGWIGPSLSDLIVNDVRAGFLFEALCARQGCDGETASAVIALAVRNGFLTEDEGAFRVAAAASALVGRAA
jgi:hypothetical protein